MRLSSVSIPERVWGGLEPSGDCWRGCKSFVSIPERVWGGLERDSAVNAPMTTGRFQSLRGFGVGWSAPTIPPSRESLGFQSLRGFGVGWSESLN